MESEDDIKSYNDSESYNDDDNFASVKINEEKKENNFKCLKCSHKFYINLKENIMCPNCGYRILDKLRTKKHIVYKTE
jgi:DNA-directed RNA polymerase subunit RPC12/RpoP